MEQPSILISYLVNQLYLLFLFYQSISENGLFYESGLKSQKCSIERKDFSTHFVIFSFLKLHFYSKIQIITKRIHVYYSSADHQIYNYAVSFPVHCSHNCCIMLQ
jgi:hypothetical protein